jgi:hypothetical protein
LSDQMIRGVLHRPVEPAGLSVNWESAEKSSWWLQPEGLPRASVGFGRPHYSRQF